MWLETFDLSPSFGTGAEVGGEKQEGKNKVTEADIVRVRENQEQAKKVQGQIAQSKRNNIAIAEFIALLLKHIGSDTIIHKIYVLFFTKENQSTKSKEIKNEFYALVLIGLFVPFFQKETEVFGLRKTFEKIFHFGTIPVTSEYIKYIEKVTEMFKATFFEQETSFVFLISEILFYFWLVDKSQLDETKRKQLEKSILEEFLLHAKEKADHDHIHLHTRDREE